MQTDQEIQQILEQLNRDNIKAYPKAVLDMALQYEEALTPHLIGILKGVLTDHTNIVNRERYFGHVFAINLLSHFENQDAHETIAKLMLLPRDVVDPLFEDMITEDFPRILYQTCGGNYESIKDLALNKKADEFVRGSALKSLVWGVLFGDLPRLEAMDFLGKLFTGSEAEDSSLFWDEAASCICDLYPEELMDTIRDAYERGLIWPGYIDMESFDRALSEDRDIFLQQARQDLGRSIREDFHGYMSWWACFDGGIQPSLRPAIEDTDYKVSRTDEKRKKKTKRRTAKASRKKNRKR